MLVTPKYGNRPPIDNRNPIYGNSVSTASSHCRELRRKADNTEFQYRPRIVDMDIDCGPRFCGPRFRDSYSGLVSCDSAAIRIRIRAVRCQLELPAKRQRHKPCETKVRFFPHFSLLVVRNWSTDMRVPQRVQFHAAIRVTTKRCDSRAQGSETGRIRFRRVRFQTPNSVSFLGLTEFRGANSVSSSRPIICVQTRTHRVSRRTHRVCRRTQ